MDGVDAAWIKWTGLPARRGLLVGAASFMLGAIMEGFMLNVWIKDTNCVLPPATHALANLCDNTHITRVAVYKVVLKKEAERRAEKVEAEQRAASVAIVSEEDAAAVPFGLLIKQQWEEKRRALELEKEKAR
jgi:hypothetical protein